MTNAEPARLHPLGVATASSGRCYAVPLPASIPPGDSVENARASTLRLFENGIELGPGHALHADIETLGGGRFSHWGGTLLFSTSDDTTPNHNRRQYLILIEPPPSGLAALLRNAANELSLQASAYQRFETAERLFNALVPDVKVSEYGRTYFADAEFASFYERFGEGNYRAYDRRYVVDQLARHAVALPGDFVECGVYRGATAWLMARTLARHAPVSRQLHLFDSFYGLSKPGTQDGRYWAAGDMKASLDDVCAALSEFADRTVFHPGWIPERFVEVDSGKFAFVHVDVDLYQPTRDSIAYFYERIVPGGMLLCDDYGFASCPGARRAMDDFFVPRGETIIHLPTGQGLVIRSAT